MMKSCKKRLQILGITFWTSVVLMMLAVTTFAGDLEPSAAPAPTMHTLDEIYTQVQALSTSSEAIPSDSIYGVSTGINMTVTGPQGVIEGSSTIPRRENTINVLGFEHSITMPYDTATGQPTGKRIHGPISTLKYFDKATPLLYTSLSKAEVLPSVVINFYREDSSGSEVIYYTIELENARILEIHATAPNIEKILFFYEKILWEYNGPDGVVSGEDYWTSPVI